MRARLILPGPPVGMGRPRADTRRRPVRIHNPQKSIDEQKRARDLVEGMWTGEPLGGPLRVDVLAYFAMPPSWSGAKKRRMSGEWHTSKPDRDNIEKLYLDALNGLVWKDDALIADGRCAKFWAPVPRVEVTVEALT